MIACEVERKSVGDRAIGTTLFRNPLAIPVVRPDIGLNACTDAKEASGVPAQKKPAAFGTALVKTFLAAAGRLASSLSPQPVLQPIPVRVKSGRRH